MPTVAQTYFQDYNKLGDFLNKYSPSKTIPSLLSGYVNSLDELSSLIPNLNGGGNTDYSSAGSSALSEKEYQNYITQQMGSVNSAQAASNDLTGYFNYETPHEAVPGLTTISSSTPGTDSHGNQIITPTTVTATPKGYTYVPDPTGQGQGGYNPTGDQGGNLTSLQGYLGESTTGGGSAYYAPVPFNPSSASSYLLNDAGYIDFGSSYDPQTNPNDYKYFGSGTDPAAAYMDALAASDPGGGKIVYGSVQNPLTQAEQYGATQTVNGVTYNMAPGGDPANFTKDNFTQTAAAPAGTQSFDASGQPVASPIESNTPEGVGTEGTFYYGNNGSLGSISGVFSNNTPGQSTNFYSNEPASLIQNSSPSSGTFQGQTGQQIQGQDNSYFYSPTKSGQNQGGVNQALGDIGGYNPLGYGQTEQTSFTSQDSALGFYGDTNQFSGQNNSSINPSNPALSALTQQRSQYGYAT